MVCCCIFPIFPANSDQEAIQFDLYCPFKDFIYVFSRIYNKFPPNLIYFLVFKLLLKKLLLGQYGLTHIVLSRILSKFPLKLVFKCLLKNCTLRLLPNITSSPILSFQGSSNYNFHQKLIFLFWCSKIYSKNCIRDNMF